MCPTNEFRPISSLLFPLCTFAHSHEFRILKQEDKKPRQIQGWFTCAKKLAAKGLDKRNPDALITLRFPPIYHIAVSYTHLTLPTIYSV